MSYRQVIPGGNVSYVQPGFDDSGWAHVTLPHDWALTGPFIADGPHGGMGRLPSAGIGRYRRSIDVPMGAAGKSIFLDVDGAMSYATMWVNGTLVGGWPYGCNSWRPDLTRVAKPGRRNTIASAIHLLDAAGRPGRIAVARIAPRSVVVPTGGGATVTGEATLADPKRWGPPPTQAPHRYVAISTVMRGGRVVDRYETRFGIRDIRFDATTGMIVNGERVRLQGVNNHHDLGALGAAFNRRAAQRQLEILRDMGANALRMSHHPPAPGLLDLADEMGFLVIDEMFDSWERKKTPLDSHLIFPDWHEPDLRAMRRRDRNHPSIVM